MHALMEQDTLEPLLSAAPAELVTALLQQTRRQLSNPQHADCAVAVMHCLLASRLDGTSGDGVVGWVQQLQSIMAEELRAQEQLLNVLGLARSLTNTI